MNVSVSGGLSIMTTTSADRVTMSRVGIIGVLSGVPTVDRVQFCVY